MTVNTMTAKMVPYELEPGAVITLEAISPTTGLAITGVTVTAVLVFALEGDAAGGGDELLFGPFLAVPGPNA